MQGHSQCVKGLVWPAADSLYSSMLYFYICVRREADFWLCVQLRWMALFDSGMLKQGTTHEPGFRIFVFVHTTTVFGNSLFDLIQNGGKAASSVDFSLGGTL